MTLHPLEGHENLRAILARALRAGRLPATLLFHGASGVGKQRLALWTGQLLLCDDAANEASEGLEPCGTCRGCRLSLRLEHPDLHWYFPLAKPPARGSPEKDRQALEEARQEHLAAFRERPFGTTQSDKVRGIHIGTVQNLLREAAKRPAVGERRLFLIAEAEALVAQESSAEAANALLKALEEPPAGTWFILTSSEPGRLLPTIRSRATSLHVPRLPDQVLRETLIRNAEASEDEADKAVALAGGSIGRALGFLSDEDEEGPLERTRKDAFRLLRAVLAHEDGARFAQALSVRPAGARGLHELFTSLGTWVRDLAVVAESDDATVLNLDAEAWLRKAASTHRVHPFAAARCIELVEAARARAAGNVNPQLLLANLLFELRYALQEGHSPQHAGPEEAG